MIIRKGDATPVYPNSSSTIFDYPMPDEATGLSFQNLNGRLPEKGSYRNKICREFFFITKGTARITIDGKEYEVREGDVVVLMPNQIHFGEYDDVSMLTISEPNWTEEQCEIVFE
jgi:mannose-6-phosphate isomerase-like protein (cupin superfamily)